MSDTPEQVIASVLPGVRQEGAKDATAHAIVRELRREGYEIVKLPEPNERGRWASTRSHSDPGYLNWSVGVNGSVPFASARRGNGEESKAAEDHAAFAAALLAAARHAESGGNHGE
ncbi:hypothetical protein ACPXCG_18815 [Gordonia sp. DT218]|uniref:hypothetical protein n=1 Tax=Gordonia sp. DT218 TaxID=3416659 RepID=UPI003CEA9A16